MLRIKLFLKLILIYLIRPLGYIFYLFPIKENRLLFFNSHGQNYSCNPKYISEFLSSEYSGIYEIIWVINNKDILPFLNVKTVKAGSLSFYYYFFTSKILISNNHGYRSFLIKRKSQVRIETWHGGGAYKKFGTDINSSSIYAKIFSLVGNETDMCLSSCRKFIDIASKALCIDSSKFVPTGMPRNDIFFRNYSDIVLKVKKHYNLDSSTKIALYAPTWRDNKRNVYEDINITAIIQTLNCKFGNKWVFLFRAHPGIKLNILNNQCLNVSTYPDMQELLCSADILITDYSSCIWDFSLTYKPCFIYATDLQQYEQERSFYTAIREWPFPLAETNEELIGNILNFNQNEYQKKIKQHHEALGSYETGNACEIVAQIIYDICYNRKKLQ